MQGSLGNCGDVRKRLSRLHIPATLSYQGETAATRLCAGDVRASTGALSAFSLYSILLPSPMHLPLLERLSTSSKGPLPASEKTAPQFQEIESGQRARDDLVERQKAIIDAQTAEILNLRSSKEKYVRWYRTTKDRISELEKEIEAVSRTHEETLEKQNRLIHEMGDRLRRTRGLSTTELTEDTRGESSLSPPDRVSEVEALAIVHDLNENVFQVAANLTEEWEELSSSPSDRFAITGDYVDALSNLYAPALVQQVLDRNPAAVTFLVQSSLCGLVAQITSNWRRNQEVKLLRSVCHLLSLSGKHCELYTASGMRLTRTRGSRHLS